MILPENVNYVGWSEVKDLRGFDPDELADLFKSYGIKCEVYEGKLITENSRTAERTINLLYDAKHHPRLYRLKQLLKAASDAFFWFFHRYLLCYNNYHVWTSDAMEGKQPPPEDMRSAQDFLNGYAKMYCKYCKVESELSRATREALNTKENQK